MTSRIEGFEDLHKHSDYSLLDGYGTVEEYAERAVQINQRFLSITDHGMMAAIPRQIKACEDNNLIPIFGCELYVNPMQPEWKPGQDSADYTRDLSPVEKKLFSKSFHLLAIAYNEVGYSNLVQLTSWGWTKGFYRHPRVNHEQLLARKEGIIFTSCCYNSEVGQAFDRGGEDEAFPMLEKYMAMFGENYYLEIMLLDFKKQKPYDLFIIKAHQKYGLPMIVTNDCHYCQKEDSKMQRYMLMIQTKNTIQKMQQKLAEDSTADFFELQDTNLWLKSEEEINEKWLSDYSDVIEYDILAAAKRNTVKICERAKSVELDRSMKLPQFDNEEERLKEALEIGFQKRQLPNTDVYRSRLKEECELICQKGFASYFLIQKKMVDEARRICPQMLGWGDGSEAVGPGRGSAVGSLCCYCLGITDVDPIKHDLLFSRFLSPARGGKSLKLRFSIDPVSIDELNNVE